MMILWVAVLAVVIVVGLMVLKQLAEKGEDKGDTKKYNYEKKARLFTPAELSFLGVLKQAVNENIQVLGKVRVADVLSPEKGLNRSEYQTTFNKISRKHFDFLLCDKKDMSIVCAIELHDKSHNQKDRQDRDDFLRDACESANLKFIEFSAKSSYNIQDIKNKL